MAFKRGTTHSIYVPTRSGASVIRGTGTADKQLANKMERMVKTLADKLEWDLLAALTEGGGGATYTRGGKSVRRREGRITLGELYSYYAGNSLAELRTRLNDVDLEPHVADWAATLTTRFGEGRKSSDTATLYPKQVRTLIAEGERFPRSELTAQRINRWLATLTTQATGTKLRYHAALSSFCEYLVSISILPRNVVRDVKAPAAGDPREVYLEGVDEMVRLIEAQPAPFNVASALAHSGVEMGAMLTIRRRDVDASARTVHVRGTKNKYRNRTVCIPAFAWPYVAKHVATLLPNALLFEGIDGRDIRAAHHKACKAIGAPEGYRVHDARHSLSVWLARSGVPPQVAAHQLGHANTKMVMQVYAKHQVTAADVAGWLDRAESKATPQAVQTA